MLPILIGLETEYGFTVEGHGAGEQIDDATMLVRGIPGEHFVGWDYTFESPRSDLRGFAVDRLNYDPTDAQYDSGKVRASDAEIRSDRVLANGARFYNDHGHPEYATPECRSVREVALQDCAGDLVVLAAAAEFEKSSGRSVRVYKNNSDGHGSSYGTHESYLAPRTWGFERLLACVCPVLVARQVVCGAGKVGAEHGSHCDFQISQRADFFTESASVDTLFRRPVFNTRDEPHSNANDWIRLHVICGDANRISLATQRKFALVKQALWLEEIGKAPTWRLQNPVAAFQSVSRDLTTCGRIELEGGSWTTARHILESYDEAAERFLPRADEELAEVRQLSTSSLEALDDWTSGGDLLTRTADWAAKLRMIQQYIDAEDLSWSDPMIRSFDLSYHCLNEEEDLHLALKELDLVDAGFGRVEVEARLAAPQESTRARARSHAVRFFEAQLHGVSWGSLTFDTEAGRRNIRLRPDVEYSVSQSTDLEQFLGELEAQQ